MAHDLQHLPRPYFIPGPDGSWIVPSTSWSPKTIWDLVVKHPVFVACPTYGPPLDNALDSIYHEPVRNLGNLGRSQVARLDPCYFAVGLLEPTDYDVAVLPTIEEEGDFVPSPAEADMESPMEAVAA